MTKISQAFGFSLLLNLLLAGTVLVMLGYPGGELDVNYHHDTPAVSLAPRWDHTLAQDFPGCHNIDNKPDSVIPDRVVVVTTSGDAKDMAFDKAWSERKSGRFTTVGWCA